MHRIPAAWLAGCAAEPVSGMGGAATWRLRDASGVVRYVKMATERHAGDLRQEIARTRWLAARGVRVPAVLDAADGGTTAAMLMEALPGVAPQACGRAAAGIVAAIARAFAALHALPAGQCPFDETVAARLARARADIRRGAVDPSQFDARNSGQMPEQIHDRLAASVPRHEDLVVVHGDATFDNILIDANGEVGFIDCGRAGRADRYTDLALLSAEIAEHFGSVRVKAFARSYGLPRWDGDKAGFFRDLYELF